MRNGLRAIARLTYRAVGHYPVTIQGVKLKVDPYHLGFWRDLGRGRWEPELLAFLRDELSPSATFLDVGAWIGPASIIAARRCLRVFSIEPDPVAYRHLLWNIDLNALTNIMPFHVALGSTTSLRRMSARGSRLGDSKSTLLPGDGSGAEVEILCYRWQDWLAIAGHPKIDCMKIDIEGGEFELMPAMREYLASERPAIHLSLHAPLLPEAERESSLATLLDVLGVYPYWYNERKERVSQSALAQEALIRNSSFIFSNR
jgi:FkbM family methyltransferase